MVRAHGPLRAKKLRTALSLFESATTLAAFAPPMSAPLRCHELSGDRKGLLSVDLDQPYRLVFRPIHSPLPLRAEGGLDWTGVTAIEIVSIEDTHG